MFTIDKKILHTKLIEDPFINYLYTHGIRNNEHYNIKDIMPFWDIEKQNINKNLIIAGENLEEYYWNGLFENLISYVDNLICFGYELFHPRYEFYLSHMDVILKKHNKILQILCPWISKKKYSNIEFLGKHWQQLTFVENHYLDNGHERKSDFFGLFRLDKYNRPFRKIFHDKIINDSTLMQKSKIFNNKTQDIRQIHDMSMNLDLEYGYDSVIPHTLYQKYSVEIISEVNVENNDIFYPTEKVFKPLIYGFPFVVYAEKGFLRGLHSMGFKTFNEIFNERYDLETDPMYRMHKILETLHEIKRKGVSNIFQKCKEVCQHNQDVAYTLKGKFELHNKKMYDKIMKLLKI